MRLTTSGLRSFLVSPASFIAAAKNPSVGGATFGNTQRAWLEAAIRAYFNGQKDEDALWQTLDERMHSGGITPRKESLGNGAARLLEEFVAWDRENDEVPADTFPRIRDVALGNHALAVRRDLIYLDATGYRSRQLWTTHDLRPHHPHAIEMAAAVLLSLDGDLGAGSTEHVEVWGLRHRTRIVWNRSELLPHVQSLRQRLDHAAAEIQNP